MKFYIASKFERKDKVREIFSKLKEMGHEISSDWTDHRMIRPFSQNIETSKEYSVEDIEGVKSCDVFIVLGDTLGSGMMVELGAAIALNVTTGKPKIYAVGKDFDSMFFFHKSINRRKSIEDVLIEL